MSNMTYHTPEEAERAINALDWQLAQCVRMIQAFVNHMRHPGTFGSPSAEQAEECWRAAVRIAGEIRSGDEIYIVGEPLDQSTVEFKSRENE